MSFRVPPVLMDQPVVSEVISMEGAISVLPQHADPRFTLDGGFEALWEIRKKPLAESDCGMERNLLEVLF